MNGYCKDCGTKTSSGICPNCQEELYIYTNQSEDLPEELSPEFSLKVQEQVAKLRKRRGDEYEDILL